jgi:hypothetical protein
MQLSDLAYLGNLARSVDLNAVQHVTLSPPYSSPSSQNTNYLPNCSQITGVISQMFGIQGNCIPQSDGGAADPITPPSPSAEIHTGTTSLPGGTQQPLTSRQIAGPNFNSMDIVGGVHALLDIMFMTVFQSFNAAQV